MAIRGDLHVHPLLNTWFLGRNPGTRHGRPPFFLPFFNYVDYVRAHAAGVRLLFSVIWMPSLPWRSTIAAVERLIRRAERHAAAAPVPVRVVRTAEQVRAAARDGCLALVHAVEGGHVLGADEASVDRLAALGVRYLTLVHFIHNRIGGAAAVPFGGQRGLTPFGRAVVRRMYRRGIIADLAHATERTFWDVLEEATGPVTASHSGARQFALRDRNLTANQAKAIAHSGGVIGVVLCPWYLTAGRIRGSLRDLIRTVAYFTCLVGAEHVAIGSDLDGWLWPVREIRDIADYEVLGSALASAGFSSSDAELVTGESLVRMLQRADDAQVLSGATSDAGIR